MRQYNLIGLPHIKDLSNGETKSQLAKDIYGDMTFDGALPQDWVNDLVKKIRADTTMQDVQDCPQLAYHYVVSQMVWGYPDEGENHIFGLPLAVTQEAHEILLKHDSYRYQE